MILDHLAGLELADASVPIRANELQSLAYLWQGLTWLDKLVGRVEDEARERLGGTGQRLWVYPTGSLLADLPMGLVASSFHWYAVSACNLVRLVGWLGEGEDPKRADEYLRRIAPRMKTWRDKVGAHFAQASPGTDTPAERAASVMFPIGFEDDCFVARPATLLMTSAGRTTSSIDVRWSLTKTHADLTARYRTTVPDEEI